MATKKKEEMHYYVLVISEEGPKFVTKVNYSNKTAEWNWEEKPLELSKDSAKDLAFGLSVNMNVAYVVSQAWEITSHPYNYYAWNIKWDKKEIEDAEEE